MNLIIDIGNSSVKLAVFKENSMLDFTRTHIGDLEGSVKKILTYYPEVKQIILASVTAFDRRGFCSIFNAYNPIFVDSDFDFPFANLYNSTSKLGVDRLALVSAAVFKYPGQNVLVIDAGSCITYDFVDTKADYHGGAISPGLKMRYKALHHQTDRLPLLAPNLPNQIIGNSTEESIHSGVVGGVVQEIEGIISSYRSNFPNLTVILTGGDANFLCKQFKISIFVLSNFLLDGLNFLLEMNSNK